MRTQTCAPSAMVLTLSKHFASTQAAYSTAWPHEYHSKRWDTKLEAHYIKEDQQRRYVSRSCVRGARQARRYAVVAALLVGDLHGAVRQLLEGQPQREGVPEARDAQPFWVHLHCRQSCTMLTLRCVQNALKYLCVHYTVGWATVQLCIACAPTEPQHPTAWCCHRA